MPATPTPAQLALIDHFAAREDQRKPGYQSIRTTRATYHACERRGWLVVADAWPYHRSTPLGRQVLAEAAEPPQRVRLSKAELVEAVKDHAREHYEQGGWDVVVECWTNDEIAEHIGRARTVRGAIAKFEPLVDVWADRQADAVNSAF